MHRQTPYEVGHVCLFATEGRLKPQGLIWRIAFGLADVYFVPSRSRAGVTCGIGKRV